jgi:hypothetical protein
MLNIFSRSNHDKPHCKVIKTIESKLQSEKAKDMQSAGFPALGNYIVLNNGTDYFIAGKGTKIVNTHNNCILLYSKSPPLVDFVIVSATVSKEGKQRTHIILVHNAIYLAKSKSLLSTNHLRWFDLSLDKKTFIFSSTQSIKGDDFEIPLF